MRRAGRRACSSPCAGSSSVGSAGAIGRPRRRSSRARRSPRIRGRARPSAACRRRCRGTAGPGRAPFPPAPPPCRAPRRGRAGNRRRRRRRAARRGRRGARHPGRASPRSADRGRSRARRARTPWPPNADCRSRNRRSRRSSRGSGSGNRPIDRGRGLAASARLRRQRAAAAATATAAAPQIGVEEAPLGRLAIAANHDADAASSRGASSVQRRSVPASKPTSSAISRRTDDPHRVGHAQAPSNPTCSAASIATR